MLKLPSAKLYFVKKNGKGEQTPIGEIDVPQQQVGSRSGLYSRESVLKTVPAQKTIKIRQPIRADVPMLTQGEKLYKDQLLQKVALAQRSPQEIEAEQEAIRNAPEVARRKIADEVTRQADIAQQRADDILARNALLNAVQQLPTGVQADAQETLLRDLKAQSNLQTTHLQDIANNGATFASASATRPVTPVTLPKSPRRSLPPAPPAILPPVVSKTPFTSTYADYIDDLSKIDTDPVTSSLTPAKKKELACDIAFRSGLSQTEANAGLVKSGHFKTGLQKKTYDEGVDEARQKSLGVGAYSLGLPTPIVPTTPLPTSKMSASGLFDNGGSLGDLISKGKKAYEVGKKIYDVIEPVVKKVLESDAGKKTISNAKSALFGKGLPEAKRVQVNKSVPLTSGLNNQTTLDKIEALATEKPKISKTLWKKKY